MVISNKAPGTWPADDLARNYRISQALAKQRSNRERQRTNSLLFTLGTLTNFQP